MLIRNLFAFQRRSRKLKSRALHNWQSFAICCCRHSRGKRRINKVLEETAEKVTTMQDTLECHQFSTETLSSSLWPFCRLISVPEMMNWRLWSGNRVADYIEVFVECNWISSSWGVSRYQNICKPPDPLLSFLILSAGKANKKKLSDSSKICICRHRSTLHAENSSKHHFEWRQCSSCSSIKYYIQWLFPSCQLQRGIRNWKSWEENSQLYRAQHSVKRTNKWSNFFSRNSISCHEYTQKFPLESSICELSLGIKETWKSIAAMNEKLLLIYVVDNLRFSSKEHVCWNQRGQISYHESRSSFISELLFTDSSPQVDPRLAFTSYAHKNLFIFSSSIASSASRGEP